MPKSTDARDKRIFELRALGLSQRAIAKEVGCGQSTVGVVLNPAVADRKRARNRKYQREQYYADPEVARAKTRDYRTANPAKRRSTVQQWSAAHPSYGAEYRRQNADRIRESGREYTRTHAEERREYRAANRDRSHAGYQQWIRSPGNADLNRERVRAWKRSNPEGVRASNNRRRGRRSHHMDAVDKLLSVEYRKAIASDPCTYCGAPGEHDEHLTPIARGGTDHWWNLHRACQRCNYSKRTMTHEEFLSVRSHIVDAA